jgi:hypothetical protein
MSYFGNRLSITSAIGVNSDTAISGGNWSTNTYTGTGELNDYAYVGVNLQVDEAGTLYFDFSQDGTNWSTFPVDGFTIASGINEVHTAWKGGRYIRPRFVGVGGRTYFRLKTFYSNLPLPLSAPLNSAINSDQDASVVRSVIVGETEGGKYVNVPVDVNGHLEVAVHSPRLPFGAIHVENLTPVFQYDAVYGINAGSVSTNTSGSGTATASDSNFVVTTGTTVNSQGVIQGRKRLRYRPGQGIVGRFTALFSSPVSNSYQIAGFGHAEDGVYFGYREIAGNTPAFGILYVNRAYRETRTITVTTASSTTESVTITLNGVAFSVPVTNSANIQKTVYEISQGTYTGWDAYPSGATVVFVANSSGSKSGTYSFVATTAVVIITQNKAGTAGTETFIAQSSWNGDKMDGTGNSGITLDPTKGNVYQIDIQYLGYGSIVFKIEGSLPGNNPDWIAVHSLDLPNTLSTTSFGNPAFPFTLASYSAGSTTNLTVKSGSVAGFIEGMKMLHGNRFTYYNQLTTVGSTNLQAVFTIMNTRYYGGRANQSVINLLSVSGALKHNSPCILYLIKGGTLAGNPNFQSISSNSSSLWDIASTTVTYTTGDQLLWTGHLGDTGEIDHHFGNGTYNAEELTLQPGEWVTLAARSVTGSPTYVTGSINTREDQ